MKLMRHFARPLIKQWLFTKIDTGLRYGRSFFMFPFSFNLHDQACNMNFEKENFLRTKLIPLLQKLNGDTPPLWGKMNARQMIEHMIDVVMVANGKIKLPTETWSHAASGLGNGASACTVCAKI